MDNLFIQIDNDLTDVVNKYITFEDHILWEHQHDLNEYHSVRNQLVEFIERVNRRENNG
ncbi:MAG: hypothetical protein P8H35_00395 [Flavobacteriales bacterium]|nr:hypothetical protein [Flavobacteriales bacterium]